MNDNASPSRHRADNFDSIRIIAAGSVIFSHAFLIADGHERNEPFIRFLGQPHALGVYGVFVFLIISGFLVTHSFLTSPTLSSYLWKRFLRIYPGLAACALISACVIAPLFADTTMRSAGNSPQSSAERGCFEGTGGKKTTRRGHRVLGLQYMKPETADRLAEALKLAARLARQPILTMV